MDAVLKGLLALRDLDVKMATLRRTMITKPAALASHRRQVAEAEAELAEVRDQVKTLQKMVDQRNVTLQLEEEQIKKLSGQLNSLKTNEDYQTMLRQIATRKATVLELEEKVLEGMEVVEGARHRIPEKEARLKAEKATLGEEEKRVAKEMADMTAQLAVFEVRWNERSAHVEDSVLRQYRHLRERFEGTALSGVSPDGVCDGCHTRVTSNVLNQALAGHLVDCNNCHRMLYLP
jgi:predicted  nucleic acid-binding Zn-ribbon protein